MLYNVGFFRSQTADVATIVVGNLSLGGSGKTPHTAYIAALLLKKKYQIAILSRGYGRKTSGFVLANDLATPNSIGDEPHQFYQQFGNKVAVAVCENRVEGIKKLLKINPNIDIVLLDDGFQHRKLKAGLYILLTHFSRPFFKDFVFPYGNLREKKTNASRADVVIYTHSPKNMNIYDKKQWINKAKQTISQTIVFSNYKYLQAIDTEDNIFLLDSNLRLLLFTGIANAKPLIDHLETEKNIALTHLQFKDHHQYTKKDAKTIIETHQTIGEKKHAFVLTTQKDVSKLLPYKSMFDQAAIALVYLPIQIEMNPEDTALLNKKIMDYVINAILNKKYQSQSSKI